MKLLEKAYYFSKKKHKGQFRFDGVTPYFTHCEKVASLVDTELEKAIAYCHDLIEDNRCTDDELAKNVSPKIVTYCLLLTKIEDETYEDYIRSFVKDSSLSIDPTGISTKIKIADIVANLSDKPSKNQIIKYNKALRILARIE